MVRFSLWGIFLFFIFFLFLIQLDHLFSKNLRSSELIPFLPLTTPEYNKSLASLGKKLFFEKGLSQTGKDSCASCHLPHQEKNPKTQNNVPPSLINIGLHFRYYSNGSSLDLVEQALLAFVSSNELANNKQEIENFLQNNEEYQKLFAKNFPNKRITAQNVAVAIAEFEKALVSTNSRFDQYLRREIELSKQEEEGFLLFKRVGCIACHNGINFGSNSLQQVQISSVPHSLKDSSLTDAKYKLVKVASLRNIGLKKKFFKRKELTNLEETVAIILETNFRYPLPKQKIQALTVFLKTLSGRTPEILEDVNEY